MVIMSIENYEKMMRRCNVYEELKISELQITEEKTKDARSSLGAMRENMAYRLFKLENYKG